MTAAARQALAVLREVLELANAPLAGANLRCGDFPLPACLMTSIHCCGKPVDAVGRVKAAITALEQASRAALIGKSLKLMTDVELIAHSQACRERWALVQASRRMGGTWRPVFTEQEHRDQQQYIKDNELPF